jgi:hypothetical protein
MSLPGPSSLGRVAACPTSEALPHAQSSTRFSRKGNVIHGFFVNCRSLGREEALLKADPEDVEVLEEVPVERFLHLLDPSKYVAEVSFGFNVAKGTSRVLGHELEREQARSLAHAGEMVGTADLAGITAKSVVIHDWKTGRGHVDRAEINWQTRSYALFAARAYQRDHAVGSIIRVLDDGTVWYDYFEMDALDLDSHESALRELMALREEVIAAAPADRPQLHEGEHCRYCPALPFCPAKVSLVQALVAEGEPVAAEVTELTPARAASAWAKIEMAETLLARLKAVVKDYARQTPVPTAEGWVLGEVEESRETLVPARARGALVSKFGEQLGVAVFSESVEKKETMTKAALKASLRKFVLPTLPKEKAKIGQLEDSALDELRAQGAVSVASFRHVKEHKVKADKASEAAA